MTKKRRRISVIAGFLVLALFAAGFFMLGMKGYVCSVGRYLETSHGGDVVVLGSSPVQMSNQTGRDLFAGLDTGDKILVIHDGMDTSYPGRTGVYAILKLCDGSVSDIPQAVVDGLTELGWLAVR